MTFPFINHLKGGPIGGPVGGPIDKKIEDLKDLSDRQKIILDLIKKDPRVSKSKNSMKIKINESAIQKHLNTLNEKGYILRLGGNRGYWQLNLTKK